MSTSSSEICCTAALSQSSKHHSCHPCLCRSVEFKQSSVLRQLSGFAPPPFCRWLSCSLQTNRCLINTASLIGTVTMSACPCQKPAASEPCTSAVHISTACIVPRGAGHCFRADCYTQIKFPEFDTTVMGTTGSPVCPHQWWGLSRWLCYRAPSA